MPLSDHHGKVFDRSFDTASLDHTSDSHETGPSHRSKRTVPYVNERREFDPRYDPRKPETYVLYHQPKRELFDDEDRVSPDAEHLTNSQTQSMQQGAATNSRMLAADPRYSRAIGHYDQRRQMATPVSFQSSTTTVKARGAFFHPDDARLQDRPFDESSNSQRESAAEIDSLDEVLQQDSFTTETTGEERFQNVLSAIEEQPTLEAGSLSYSFTQLGGAGSMLRGTKSSESASERGQPRNLSSRSHSPLDARVQAQDTGNIFRFQEEEDFVQSPPTRTPDTSDQMRQPTSSRTIEILPEKPKYIPQSVRRPLRVDTWDTSNQSSTDRFGSPRRAAASATLESPSATGSSLSPSEAAQLEAEKWLKSRRRKEPNAKSTNENKSTNPIASAASASTTEETETFKSEEQDLTLHDLCGESSSTDDIAWRNALHVLSIQPQLASVLDSAGWTPLHVACLGSTPPPLFMTRSLLYVYREAARKVDGGGRLPLHLVAASSGDAETMQLLVQEYPQAVWQTDCQGWTPLHLILKNFSVDVSLNHCRVLLGMTASEEAETISPRVLQRRGEHLSLRVEELDRVIPKTTPVTRIAQENMHEEAFRDFPLDVQVSLRRLCQWKRKQRRQTSRTDSDEAVELDSLALSLDAETNPAAHFTPVKRQLPIHIVVRRGLSESRSQQRRNGEDEDGWDDREEPTSTSFSPRFFDLVRLFIAFYPEGLIARDFNGHTPLLTALSMSSAQPSLELVELLLGKRTSGYNSLPSWAHNMPLYNLNADRYLNPAMIPSRKSHQLPLHAVAEEMANNFAMLASVHGCYPGAIQCQDSRGRTPLHILLRNYRRNQVDPRTIALLLSDDVAQTLDDEAKLPFDLLAETARNIPLERPQTTDGNGVTAEDILIFKKFFQGTIIAASEPNVRNRLESESFLWRLRSLPPWLRRQACSATFVQELLIEELASPAKCGLIMLYATLLCALIVGFRIQVHHFIENPEATMPAWTILIVYGAAAGLALFQVIFWSLCMSMSEFLHLCVFNMWRWVDLSAFVLVCASTTLQNYSKVSNEVILATSTAATGLLWFSAVGFFSSWWCGASLFMASVQQVARLLLWPFVVTAVLAVGFSQMFYTIAYVEDCKEALGDNSICSIRESYLFIYYLIVGEPVVDIESDTKIPGSILTLTVLFIISLLLLALSMIAIVMLAGSNCDYEELALTSFWEPKLTFVIFAGEGKGSAFSKSKSSATLETAWVVATNILSGKDGVKGTYWYACFSRKPTFVKVCYWLVAAIVVPIWILAGLLSFGLLWPPQVRQALFRPQVGVPLKSSRGSMSPPEVYASQVSSLRNELAQIRDMSYERSNEVQRDLRQLKEILHLATAE